MPLILLNKPYRVLSQFSGDDGRETLRRYVTDRSVYPAGRLDFDSEGLLLLTDDGKLQAAISERQSRVAKHYRVQVEGIPDDAQLGALRKGVDLKDGPAIALEARRIETPESIWPRNPPIRQRKTVPDAWIEIAVDEGRNRQVRRMTAAVGLPTLRLVRYRVGPWSLDGLQPGELRSLENSRAWSGLRAYATPFD